jgi:hypothetical protein
MAAPDTPVPDILTKRHSYSINQLSDEDKSYGYSHKVIPLTPQKTELYNPLQPHEHSWNDKEGSNLAQLKDFLITWITAHPNGGDIPADSWAIKLGCNLENIASATIKLAGQNWNIEHKLIAKPTNRKVSQPLKET